MDCGDFTITKREILVCISITIILIAIGLFINNGITNAINEKNEKYYKALKIENNDDMFNYAMDTNVGYAFVQGKVTGINPVEKDIEGKYFYIKKVKEKYTRHTRQVAKTKTVNGKTVTYYETEVYWTWDYAGHEESHVDKFIFSGKEFNYGDIKFNNSKYEETINESYYIRYKYYVINNEFNGTLFTKIADNKITEKDFYYKTIKEIIKEKESEIGTSTAVFWVIWVFGIGMTDFFFVYFDNHYLEDKKKEDKNGK